jgi:hypothetical protein
MFHLARHIEKFECKSLKKQLSCLNGSINSRNLLEKKIAFVDRNSLFIILHLHINQILRDIRFIFLPIVSNKIKK